MNNGCIILPKGISPRPCPRPSCRSAFTLIELIIVVGIIGVLSTVMLVSFSGGTESARAAKCLSNMHSLVQAVQSQASGTEEGHLCSAGSWAYLKPGTETKKYGESVGWISWLSQNDEYGSRGQRDAPTSFVSLENAGAYCADDQQATFAITNGVIWRSVNCNLDVYVCPSHKIVVDKKKAKLRWSYVMNAYFGYDWSDGGKAIYAHVAGLAYPQKKMTSPAVRPERRLMFAELPIYGSGPRMEEGGKASTANYPESGTETDCVLQYRAYEFNKKWSGKAEVIGFNHQSAKRSCAHVAFADGHTEKILYPKKKSISMEQLTALLCAGKDIGFDGSQYTWVNQNDKSE